jgi:hypothetical protein
MLLKIAVCKNRYYTFNIIDNFYFHKKKGYVYANNVMKVHAKYTMLKHDFHDHAHMST